MYYAQGEGGGCTPDAVRRRRRRRRRTRKVKERREREGRDEGRRGSMCVTCVAAITKSRGWLPGNAFQPPHTHTTLNQSPKPPCEISLHGVLFLPFYVALSLVPHPPAFLSLLLSNATFSEHGLLLADFHTDFNLTRTIGSMLSFSK